MIGKPAHKNRRGLVMVECSLVYLVSLMLIMGAISIGLGIFRYQQIAWLAREGARWAAVHGTTYQSEQGLPAPTSQNVITAITPKLLFLKPAYLTCTLSMVSGTASVTLSYRWTPEMFLSPITFTSKSVLPITY